MHLLSFRRRRVSFFFLPFAFATFVPAQALLVANQGNRTLRLIDPASAKQVAVIPQTVPGQWGHELATSPNGRTAYLPIYSNSGVGKPGIDGHEMLVTDVAGRRVIGKVDFGCGVRPYCVSTIRTANCCTLLPNLPRASASLIRASSATRIPRWRNACLRPHLSPTMPRTDSASLAGS